VPTAPSGRILLPASLSKSAPLREEPAGEGSVRLVFGFLTPKNHPMKSSTRDKAEGRANELKGKAKERAGNAVGNPNLRDEGVADQAAGKVQRKTGDVKKVFGK
jgi:uncharacterized protein YjbJ (UPF0337 family)